MHGETTLDAPGPGAAAAGGPAARRAWRRQQALWLIACCALVYAMVVLGGVTRLTGSGLSMVAWEPVSGVLPPLGEAEWDAEFARYRESPEFMKVNYWMSVDDFKRIFWFEWAHRLLGRSIGLAFAAPFAFFLVRRRIERAFAAKYVAMFVLGALQGLLGWYMVKSGLSDDPHVSQYRLTAHLGAAIAIYLFMLWTALDLLRTGPATRAAAVPAWLRRGAYAAAALVALTLISGGFVAGLKAGLVFNTFPKMGAHWIPAGLYGTAPAWLSVFEDVTTAQFNHRVLAIATFATIAFLWLRVLRSSISGPSATCTHLLALAVLAQVGLGVATLLLRVPVALGAAHQGGALLVLTASAVLCHLGRRPTDRAGFGPADLAHRARSTGR